MGGKGEMREGFAAYELVDGGCAYGVDQVDAELDQEDCEQDGGHCVSARGGDRVQENNEEWKGIQTRSSVVLVSPIDA